MKFARPILALDLGTQTGWALCNCDGIIVSGSQSFKPQRFEGGGMRYLRFARWLTELVFPAGVAPRAAPDPPPGGYIRAVGRIVFEEVRRHAGTDAAHVYGGLLAHLSSFCEEHEIPYEGVPVGTIKRDATGRGNANKAEMIAAMKGAGFLPADDNEADALALLRYAMKSEK